MFKREQLKKGKQVEKDFASYFKVLRWSTQQEDWDEHWDLEIELEGKPFKVDVKSVKRINGGSEGDLTKNESIHWVEIKNVKGKVGWAYGKADGFAFELNDYFLIVKKEDLQNFIKNNVKKEERNKELYYLYRRKGSLDVITMVLTLDLLFEAGYMLLRKKDGKIKKL